MKLIGKILLFLHIIQIKDLGREHSNPIFYMWLGNWNWKVNMWRWIYN